MLFNKSKPSLDSLMSTTIDIQGDVTFKDSFYLAGRVKGNVTGGADSVLIIAQTAVVEGNIYGAHIKLNGRVNGTVTSTSLLELETKANVAGDIYYNMLKMDSGAIVSGKLSHVAKSQVQTTQVQGYNAGVLKPA